jgi:phosphate transport system substrate-binding protein
LKKILILLLGVIIITGCKSNKSGKAENIAGSGIDKNISGRFTISGSFALSSLVRKLTTDFMKIHKDVEIEIIETGTGQGIVDLIDRKADLAMISRPLLDDEKEADIWEMPIAKDGVAIIVNDKNPYLPRLMKQGLSPEEIQQLFTTTPSPLWGELLDTSGRERPVVYIRADESGAADLLAGFCFRKASDLKGIDVNGDSEMINSVKNNIFSVGFCNLSYAFHTPTGERAENIHIIPFDLD